MTLLATVLFFIVFVQLFIALSLYLSVTVYTFFKKDKSTQDKTDQSEKHA